MVANLHRCLVSPDFIFIGIKFRQLLQRAALKSREAAVHRNSLLLESLTGAIQIQLLGALRPIARRYVRGTGAAVRANLAERRMQLAYSAVSLFTIACAATVMLGLGGVRVIGGGLSIGGYVAFYTYLLRLFEPLNTAIDMHARLQKARVSIRKLMEIDGLESVEAMPAQAPVAELAPEAVDRVAFNAVSFAYPGSARAGLSDVSFSVSRGDRLALTGPSGSARALC